MGSSYTNYLICAPELDNQATVGALLVQPGELVKKESSLVKLHAAGRILEVCAPDTGTIVEITISVGELVLANDLLLTMAVEEKPFGGPVMPDKGLNHCSTHPETDALDRPSGHPATASNTMASLAAWLGVDLAEVRPGPGGVVDEEAIAAHVRDIMIRWQKLRRLLGS